MKYALEATTSAIFVAFYSRRTSFVSIYILPNTQLRIGFFKEVLHYACLIMLKKNSNWNRDI